MRRLLLGALPFAVLAAMLALRAWDPLPLQQLRWFAFDQYQRLAPRAYDPATPVRIVDIDDASLARIGQWPWPRTQLAKLLERLTQAGAAAIAFDMVFAERDRSSPEQVLKQWAPTLEMATLRDSFALMPSHDSMLAAAIGQAPVVTGFALTHERAGSSRRERRPARERRRDPAIAPRLGPGRRARRRRGGRCPARAGADAQGDVRRRR